VFQLDSDAHRRFNVLSGEWVICSPHRAKRPWRGQHESLPAADVPAYDPACYLCPGNERTSGAHNPPYTSTFAFDNDFAALVPEHPDGNAPPAAHNTERNATVLSEDPAVQQLAARLLQAEPAFGLCRVICADPDHRQSLATLSVAQLEAVVRTWAAETAAVACRVPEIGYVQLFENRGAAMGQSSPHPHAQVWASRHVPHAPATELARLAAYRAQHPGEPCLLCDYVQLELALDRSHRTASPQDRQKTVSRVVYANDAVVVLVPYWAIWPFETLVLPRRHVGSLDALSAAQDPSGSSGARGLAQALAAVTRAYDAVFDTPFPYSMGVHGAPTAHAVARGDAAEGVAHLHLHFYPPLLRSATVRKFLVGFEMLGEAQRDLTPETAAERLR
ncbi:hypothetical protein CXG81DRAFT_5138, partial [Caulochytrium protostelioides]